MNLAEFSESPDTYLFVPRSSQKEVLSSESLDLQIWLGLAI